MKVFLEDVAVLDRGRKNFEKVDELAKSLATFGQIQNIVVRKPTAKEEEQLEGLIPWVLVAGERRTRAAKALGWTHLEASVLEDLSVWQQKSIELEENIQRQDMSWDEVAELRLQIHEHYTSKAKEEGKTWQQKDTAEVVKADPATVTRDLEIAKHLRENPALKDAGSRKAAQRIVAHQQEASSRMSQVTVNLDALKQLVVNSPMQDFAPLLPDGLAALTFCDLPYGLDDFSKNRGNEDTISEYDDGYEGLKPLITAMVPEFIRVTNEKGWIVLMCSWEQWHDLFAMFTAAGLKPEPKPLIWYRPNSRNITMHPDIHPSNTYEVIFVCNRGKGRHCVSEMLGNVLVFDNEYGDRVHGMQKPEALCDEIVRRYSYPGELVADFCFGSGSALRSAAKLGRRVAGCETNQVVFELGFSRIVEKYKGEVTTEEPKAEPAKILTTKEGW